MDAWNHVECLMAMSVAGLDEPVRRGYAWLARHQRADGSWPMKLVDGVPAEPGGETNHAAYVAVGVWHHHLVTGDRRLTEESWPMVKAALDYVAGLQDRARGDRLGARRAGQGLDVRACSPAAPLHPPGAALRRAARRPPGRPAAALGAGRRPAGPRAVGASGRRFADKSRFSMDWYYRCWAARVRGQQALELLEREWQTFVVPGLGIRCVSDQPWVDRGRDVRAGAGARRAG
ncbi:hypothetical protein GCM10020220_016000 [Nonomuraea rubra]|uniref:hypothetical protein n=1 Tax=Nonomuraea rubra TaxID=46180 RepID=UPI0031EBCE12